MLYTDVFFRRTGGAQFRILCSVLYCLDFTLWYWSRLQIDVWSPLLQFLAGAEEAAPESAPEPSGTDQPGAAVSEEAAVEAPDASALGTAEASATDVASEKAESVAVGSTLQVADGSNVGSAISPGTLDKVASSASAAMPSVPSMPVDGDSPKDVVSRRVSLWRTPLILWAIFLKRNK